MQPDLMSRLAQAGTASAPVHQATNSGAAHAHDGARIRLHPRQALVLHDERGEQRVPVHNHCRQERGSLLVHACVLKAVRDRREVDSPRTAGSTQRSGLFTAGCAPVPPPVNRRMSATPCAAAAARCTSWRGFLRQVFGWLTVALLCAGTRAAARHLAKGEGAPAHSQHDGRLRRAIVEHKPVVMRRPAQTRSSTVEVLAAKAAERVGGEAAESSVAAPTAAAHLSNASSSCSCCRMGNPARRSRRTTVPGAGRAPAAFISTNQLGAAAARGRRRRQRRRRRRECDAGSELVRV